jgi:hypothetical protein
MNVDTKFPNKILPNEIKQHVRMIMHLKKLISPVVCNDSSTCINQKICHIAYRQNQEKNDHLN